MIVQDLKHISYIVELIYKLSQILLTQEFFFRRDDLDQLHFELGRLHPRVFVAYLKGFQSTRVDLH